MDKNRAGFVKMKRSILGWKWYTDLPVCHLYHTLIYMADYFDKYDRGVLLKPGQILTTSKELEEVTGLSRQQIRTALKKLELTSDITIRVTNKYSVISVVNYTKHQKTFTTSNQNTNQQSNQQGGSNNHQAIENNHQGPGNNHQATNIPIIKETEEIKETIEITEQAENPIKDPIGGGEVFASPEEVADRLDEMRRKKEATLKRWGLA